MDEEEVEKRRGSSIGKEEAARLRAIFQRLRRRVWTRGEELDSALLIPVHSWRPVNPKNYSALGILRPSFRGELVTKL